jgi:hypothetical protein
MAVHGAVGARFMCHLIGVPFSRSRISRERAAELLRRRCSVPGPAARLAQHTAG